jgi:hypothetical protein
MTLSRNAQIAPIALVVAALGAADLYFMPQHALTWSIGMGAMAAVWIVAIFAGRASSARTDSDRSFLFLSVALAGLMIAVSLGVPLAGAFGIGGSTLRDRALGIVLGLMLVVMGNMVPKVLGPLTAKRCSSARTQSLQRFTGWIFTLAGLAYVGVWILLPVPEADAIATPLCAAAVVLVLLRWGWAFVSPRRDAPPV